MLICFDIPLFADYNLFRTVRHHPQNSSRGGDGFPRTIFLIAERMLDSAPLFPGADRRDLLKRQVQFSQEEKE
jgi:hypothetical protein